MIHMLTAIEIANIELHVDRDTLASDPAPLIFVTNGCSDGKAHHSSLIQGQGAISHDRHRHRPDGLSPPDCS
ncbi:hypothetical protein [Aeromonas ichthyocola]